MEIAGDHHPVGQTDDSELSLRKYEIILEAEGADGLDTPAGTEVCFVWRRRGKVSLSESAEVWDDGVVYWDARCSQVATLVQQPDGGCRPKPCELIVQAVPLDDDGLPSGLGATIASAKLDLSQFCSDQDEFGVDGVEDAPKLLLPLEPTGTLSVKVAARWVREWQPAPEDTASEASDFTLTPSASASSLCPEESLSFDGNSALPSTAGCSPALPATAARLEAGTKAALQAGVRQLRIDTEPSSVAPLPPAPDSLLVSPEPGAYATPTSSSLSSALARSTSTGSDGTDPTSISALQRRCKRLARERDEARAEAFAEASVAVQRGIEIENLRRAKDVLMQRLETTERNLVALMRLDSDSPSSRSDTATGGGKSEAGDARDAMLHSLVDAKLALAEKEFEVMELQGKVRAREAHVDALTEHLAAIRAATEAQRQSLSTPVSLPRIRIKSMTPSSLAPVSQRVGAGVSAAVGEKRASSSPVVQIYAHAAL